MKKFICMILVLLMAAALFCALFLSGDAFRLREMAETLLPAVNAVLKFGLLPLTLFIGKAQKRL